MPAVQHKALLVVIHFLRVAQNRIQARIKPAERLVAVEVNVIAKAIRAAEVILRARVVHRGICVAVDIHFGFALHPAGVVPVHAGSQRHARKAALAVHAVQDHIRASLLHRVLLPICRVKITAVFGNLSIPSGNHIEKRLCLFTAIFHCNTAVFSERHFKVAVEPAPRRDEHRS